DTFDLTLSRLALGESNRTVTVTCFGPTSSSISAGIVVHLGGITDDGGIVSLDDNGTQALIGRLDLAPPPNDPAINILVVATSDISFDCSNGGPVVAAVSVPALVSAGGVVSINGCGAGVDLAVDLHNATHLGGFSLTNAATEFLGLPLLQVVD